MTGLHKKSASSPLYSWQEVEQHNSKENAWIVIEDLVLDVSQWMKKHPGGARIISQYAGQDASEAWYAIHLDKFKVMKYMAPLLIGRVDPLSRTGEFWDRRDKITKDFRVLRHHAEDSGWFKSDPLFYILSMGQVIVLEILAYCLLRFNHTNWFNYILAVIFLTISQIQAHMNGHDYAHNSVMPTAPLNRSMSNFIFNVFAVLSSNWWTLRHSLHHTKPNRLSKDPDLTTVTNFFLSGNKIPKIWAAKRRGFAPYSLQHIYFFFVIMPFAHTVFLQPWSVYFMIKRRDNTNFLVFLLNVLRVFYLYGNILGYWQCLVMWYISVGMLRSVWFMLISQMSHITMEVEDMDTPNIDWVTLQTVSTCNVTPSAFVNWFTGHLDYQIEHHLFPTMPRHNLEKVAPLVKYLCKKHNIPYEEKTLTTAFADIYRSLRKSAQLWHENYYAKGLKDKDLKDKDLKDRDQMYKNLKDKDQKDKDLKDKDLKDKDLKDRDQMYKNLKDKDQKDKDLKDKDLKDKDLKDKDQKVKDLKDTDNDPKDRKKIE